MLFWANINSYDYYNYIIIVVIIITTIIITTGISMQYEGPRILSKLPDHEMAFGGRKAVAARMATGTSTLGLGFRSLGFRV